MKTFSPALIYVIILTVIFSSLACSKDKEDQQEKFPDPFAALAPKQMIDSLRRAGAMIYDGSTPPMLHQQEPSAYLSLAARALRRSR